jgi:hypothetical protein
MRLFRHADHTNIRFFSSFLRSATLLTYIARLLYKLTMVSAMTLSSMRLMPLLVVVLAFPASHVTAFLQSPSPSWFPRTVIASKHTTSTAAAFPHTNLQQRRSSLIDPTSCRQGSNSRLYSLQTLVENISERTSDGGPRTVFVGGKGGVGKTTVSSALAVGLASSIIANSDNKELKVLVVSTDPARKFIHCEHDIYE